MPRIDPHRLDPAHWTYGMGMFQEDRCVSVSSAVMVLADENGPVRLPDVYRARLQSWLLGAAVRDV